MKPKIIFVGGVHGVGKTFLCNRICDDLGINHYSAGDLIRKIKEIEFPVNKHIEGISDNQDALIIAVEKFLNRDSISLMDGHFCLLDSRGDIVSVPMTTFRSLSPIAIITLYDEPSNICTRIQDRDGSESEVDRITSFQEREIMYSRLVSKELRVPYLLANPFSEREAVHEFIRSIV